MATTQILTQKAIAERISHILEKKGLRQQFLADTLVKPKSYISLIMAGGANLTLSTILEIEQALGEPIFRIENKPVKVH